MRSLIAALLLCCASPLLAQSDTTRTKVVKSAAVEMKATGNTVTSTVSSTATASAPMITGDFTVSSAHPKCAQGKTTEERAKCTAGEVLAQINAHLKAERPKSLDVVAVDFDVDEYGDVKAIRTNTSSEPELGKALVVALYGLPKFEVAKKADARTTSHCSFSYGMGDLFPATAPPAGDPGPQTGTTVATTATAETPAAKAVPAFKTINSGGQLVTGDFSSPSAHPKCVKGRTAEDKVKCTANEVLLQIKQNLKAEQPAYLDQVVVDFDVDVYGDVKTIRANCSTEPDLGKAVIVALYGLPKFEAAKKETARAASHCTFSYSMADLFSKP